MELCALLSIDAQTNIFFWSNLKKNCCQFQHFQLLHFCNNFYLCKFHPLSFDIHSDTHLFTISVLFTREVKGKLQLNFFLLLFSISVHYRLSYVLNWTILKHFYINQRSLQILNALQRSFSPLVTISYLSTAITAVVAVWKEFSKWNWYFWSA